MTAARRRRQGGYRACVQLHGDPAAWPPTHRATGRARAG